MREMTQEIETSKSILMPTNTFDTMKNNLIENIGSYKTKGFLFRFGRDFGEESAKEYFANKTRNNKVGKMHTRFGHIKDVQFMGKIEKLEDGQLVFDNAWGKWIGSFEAELHLQKYGQVDECVCHTLCGFASGALSYEFGERILVLETKCIAKGDECCEYEVRLEKDWPSERRELINLYNNDNILSELEMTYDALLHHRHMLEKISAFHSQLTQKVTEKHSLEEIIESAYDLLKIGILIEDLHGNQLGTIGLTAEQLKAIKNEHTSMSYVERKHNVSHYDGLTHRRLVAPVLINKKNYATCTFFYFGEDKIEENDYLFLERIATVVALCILYEEAQFEEQERMRSSLLERLIHNHNIKNIESYYKFLPFKFQAPFTTGIIHVQKVKEDKVIIDIHDQLIQISKLAKRWDLPCIFAIIGEDIAILNSQNNDRAAFMKNFTRVLKQMEKQNKNYLYSLGLSGDFSNFKDFEQAMKEARIAQRFPNKQHITDYSELGMLGDIVTNMTIEQLREMSRKSLKELANFGDSRKKELLHTLYIYLLNGQRLKETMEELALSIGGIQYRIKQIEELLQVSLKNASTSAYLLLVIQALILSGEVEF